MDFAFFFLQFLNGLASASSLFIAACGLSIIFGVTRIVNFAHGSFYMLGAYFAVTFAPRLMETFNPYIGFWGGIICAALVVGVLGILMEMLLLRRIYHVPELFQLLATFGVVLIVQDLVVLIWGPEDILGPRAPGLKGAVIIFGERFPQYELFLVAAGPIILGAIWLLFRKTRFGVLVRAATEDREMTDALGINQKLLFTGVLFLGASLAGLAGALQIPKEPANAFMDINMIAEAFVITVIGGMGSVPGAFLAALLIGELQAFGILLFAKSTLVLAFLAMAVVLIIRPQGLLGKPAEGAEHSEFANAVPLRPWPRWLALAWLGAIALFACLPLFVDSFSLKLAIEIMVFALFAMSLNLLIGLGGVVSFGHAAWFGVGAYAAGLLAVHTHSPMLLALAAAPVAAGIAAALVGAFIARLSGVYLAMLTLAAAQLVYAIAFQWTEVTGGDDGLVGAWPDAWAKSRVIYFYLTLVLAGGAIFALRHIAYAPFGYILRAGRDGPARAEAIGINVAGARWVAFTLAGVAAGLAGGLYTFSKGSIDPTVLSIPTSVDALAMTLLGGVNTVLGPVFGAAALHLFQDFAMPLTDHWRMILGGGIIAMVLAFPDGLVGVFRAKFLPAEESL
jgi:branched-chain amino acid transport system permease protein